MTLVGRSVLLVEGARVARGTSGGGSRDGVPAMMRFQRAGLVGAFLIGLSTFQAEFDFGVPQFDMLFQAHPRDAGGVRGALVAAARVGRASGALMAVGLFVAVRGGVSPMVGPVFEQTLPHFHLYVVEAALVERSRRGAVSRPLAFGTAAGAAIGTVGLAAEWAWSHVWMPLPWSEACSRTPLSPALRPRWPGACWVR